MCACLYWHFSILFPCSAPIIQLKTKYTDNGIEQPSFFGVKSLYWKDVAEICNITTSEIILAGSGTKIRINLFLFKNPQGLLSEIRSRIPESAYPSEAQINREIYRRKQNDSGRVAIGAFLIAALVFIVGKNIYATIFGLLALILLVYGIRNWIKYRRLQA